MTFKCSLHNKELSFKLVNFIGWLDLLAENNLEMVLEQRAKSQNTQDKAPYIPVLKQLKWTLIYQEICTCERRAFFFFLRDHKNNTVIQFHVMVSSKHCCKCLIPFCFLHIYSSQSPICNPTPPPPHYVYNLHCTYHFQEVQRQPQ